MPVMKVDHSCITPGSHTALPLAPPHAPHTPHPHTHTPPSRIWHGICALRFFYLISDRLNACAFIPSSLHWVLPLALRLFVTTHTPFLRCLHTRAAHHTTATRTRACLHAAAAPRTRHHAPHTRTLPHRTHAAAALPRTFHCTYRSTPPCSQVLHYTVVLLHVRTLTMPARAAHTTRHTATTTPHTPTPLPLPRCYPRATAFGAPAFQRALYPPAAPGTRRTPFPISPYALRSASFLRYHHLPRHTTRLPRAAAYATAPSYTTRTTRTTAYATHCYTTFAHACHTTLPTHLYRTHTVESSSSRGFAHSARAATSRAPLRAAHLTRTCILCTWFRVRLSTLLYCMTHWTTYAYKAHRAPATCLPPTYNRAVRLRTRNTASHAHAARRRAAMRQRLAAVDWYYLRV